MPYLETEEEAAENIAYIYDRRNNTKYDSNGFDINGLHKDTNTKYGPEGFNRNGLH